MNMRCTGCVGQYAEAHAVCACIKSCNTRVVGRHTPCEERVYHSVGPIPCTRVHTKISGQCVGRPALPMPRACVYRLRLRRSVCGGPHAPCPGSCRMR
jgi:hypothetical protein